MAGNGGKRSRTGGSGGRDIDFEIALGSRIRAARVAAVMTQRALADAVGIAYQKLQKYELGRDRIAVSTLNRIAKALKLHPGSFFDERAIFSVGPTSTGSEAQRSAELFQQVRDPRVAQTLLALVRELGEGRGDEQETPDTAVSAPSASKLKRHRAPIDPPQAVVAPLLAMLQRSGTGDAGALAQLLGQALAEAEKIVRRPP